MLPLGRMGRHRYPAQGCTAMQRSEQNEEVCAGLEEFSLQLIPQEHQKMENPGKRRQPSIHCSCSSSFDLDLSEANAVSSIIHKSIHGVVKTQPGWENGNKARERVLFNFKPPGGGHGTQFGSHH